MSAIQIPPDELAALVAARDWSIVVGFDVDGVLAPIVDRADQAELLPGVSDALEELARHVPVAVISGRSIDDLLARYDFPEGVTVIGSHGLETRDRSDLSLDPAERERLDQLIELATAACRDAGDGAWLEHKPASVVLHVREVDPHHGSAAIERLDHEARSVEGAHVKHGHSVIELMTRHTSKASALEDLRASLDADTMVFVGDDRTDEEVFETFGPNDIGVRVGPGDTAARYRLADPSEVRRFISHLGELTGRPARKA